MGTGKIAAEFSDIHEVMRERAIGLWRRHFISNVLTPRALQSSGYSRVRIIDWSEQPLLHTGHTGPVAMAMAMAQG